jgi:hypothetical protein
MFVCFDPEVVKVATQGINRVDIECVPPLMSNGPIDHHALVSAPEYAGKSLPG